MTMLNINDPHGFRVELEKLKILVSETDLTLHEKSLLTNCFKQIIFYNHISSVESFSFYLQGIIYDSLNSIISIIKKIERYYQLNIRSLVEHIARISLNKKHTGEQFSDFVRHRDFTYLKKNHSDEIWNFLHQTYSKACLYIHSSPSAKLNVNYTFSQLMVGDTQSTQKKQVETLQKCLNSITEIIITLFYTEISSYFLRTKTELKFLIGTKLFDGFIKDH
ncbi:hypothetical protein [Morganella morganii]|uniref:Uncharacterized protein n=1 Tax=Morganella morganii TaxID=582 RepID=A0A9Q4GVF0_MORMO|nr:hypothetical protein [Morganella morganii]MCY0791940.1 hypothetical protein [Morganella morganii]